MSQTKAALRQQAKETRSLIPPSQVSILSRIIGRRLLDLVNGFETIMVYASKIPEVETKEIIQDLNRRGVRVVVPIIERETCSLRLSYLPDPSLLVPSTFNVPEPLGNELPARPEDVQVVIIPMVAFDRGGNRLGYGAGYYDRFLHGVRPDCIRLGLAYEAQLLPAVPAGTSDERVSRVITEAGLYHCQG